MLHIYEKVERVKLLSQPQSERISIGRYLIFMITMEYLYSFMRSGRGLMVSLAQALVCRMPVDLKEIFPTSFFLQRFHEMYNFACMQRMGLTDKQQMS